MINKTIGVIGLGVMGSNLVLNIERNGYTVSIFNRTSSKTKCFFKKNSEKKIIPFFTIKDFISSLKKPRCIILMVQSGIATDNTINNILPYLNKQDIIIDGGNSFYKDSIVRNKNLEKKGFYFFGTGISGGSEGALLGPAIMPGGNKEQYKVIESLFKKIAAKYQGEPCVSYIGPDGSGHYVKMIHNGIEYSDMQLISEVYALLKIGLHLNNKDISNIFSDWNKGELNSYLINITKNIFLKKDLQTNKDLIDLISDKAGNKGTGTWTVQNALELGQPLSLISESVFFRYLSSLTSERNIASKYINVKSSNTTIIKNKPVFIEKIRKSLYLGKILAYSQGFSLLKSACKHYNWNLNLSKISKIFRSGCIIQASFLNKISQEFSNNKDVKNLLLTSFFSSIAKEYQESLRSIVAYAIKTKIPVPVLSASIAYYDGYHSSFLSTNLIQAQRDYFGSHTYNRTDKDGSFTSNWI
ncbi:NADP-dependent phosphogluconate dehydrogenase [Buchnera aphidicola]|uniref:6-phosphogluconate dehydrogenase, decarboxylating n=1 Tax=Buchnera aphidicola (Anoecia oenotherae) TaxID=1241833 RepID=A0A4D6Y468_9GAMM|nr:NADP-dependent phosphogluconate dehydrogenase [Buchnera aphidicola]QCI19225.1 NADP-dependent phosphogluconate dehydrogenase [Buchnera aphidicola (Anoecia oenotherae)]